MKKNLLFDLDGTLLPLDMDEFFHSYFSGILKKIVHFGLDPQASKQGFLAGIDAMVHNDGSRTNEVAFWETFTQLAKTNKETLEPYLEQFYLNEFQEFQSHTTAYPGLSKVLHNLKTKGHRLFLATNPLFPRIATLSRIRWAGLDASLFEEITTYEHYHYCKPNSKYFVELLNKFKLDPQDCFMVGNDTVEDLCIRELKIETYLITDHLIDQTNGQYQSEYQGSMNEFIRFITEY